MKVALRAHRSSVSQRLKRVVPDLIWGESFDRPSDSFLNSDDGNPASWRKPDQIGLYDPGNYPNLGTSFAKSDGTKGYVNSLNAYSILALSANRTNAIVELESHGTVSGSVDGVVARMTDISNLFLLQRNGAGAVWFYKLVSGTYTAIGPGGSTTTPVATGVAAGSKIGLKCVGSLIYCLVNDAVVLTYDVVDAILRTGNKFGSRQENGGTNTNKIDNLKVRAISVVQGLLWSDSFTRTAGVALNFNDGNPASGRKPNNIVQDPGFYETAVGQRMLSDGSAAYQSALDTLANLFSDGIVTDHIVEVVSSGTHTGSSSGPIARRTGNNYFLLARVGNGDLTLYKQINGVQTTVAAISVGSVVSGSRIALRAVGSTLQSLVNDTVFHTHTIVDEVLKTGSGVGCFIYNGGATTTRLDDLKVSTA